MDWFGSWGQSESQVFARQLVEEIVRRYPPESERGEGRKLSPKAITQALEGVMNKASEYGQANRLGFFKKARMSNTFRWALQERGYSKGFIDLATEALVVYLTRANAEQPKRN